jgi:plastocyanin
MHPHWRFDPASFNLPAGKQVVLQNLGGEFHTWTKVAEFGGGLIPDLNFGQDARPECFAPDGINNVGIEAGEVEVGATAGSADLPSGTHKFQCCIHPWMQSTVRVN